MGGLVKGSERKRSFLSGHPSSSQSRGIQQGMERGRGEKKDRKRGGEKREKEKKKDFKQEKCCPCHFSVSPAPLWGGEWMVNGGGTGGAGAWPGRGINMCRREEAPQGGEVGEQGMSCCTNSGPVLEKMQGCRVEKGVTCPAWEGGWGGPHLPTARGG